MKTTRATAPEGLEGPPWNISMVLDSPPLEVIEAEDRPRDTEDGQRLQAEARRDLALQERVHRRDEIADNRHCRD